MGQEPTSAPRRRRRRSTGESSQRNQRGDGPRRLTELQRNVFVNRSPSRNSEPEVCVCRPESGCGEGCLNRALLIECTPGTCPCGDKCRNQRLQRCEYPPLELQDFGAKGWGVVAKERIPASSLIVEYVGEVCDLDESEARAKSYESQGMRDTYIMNLSSKEVIDATMRGNMSRFINHSCSPNSRCEKWSVVGEQCVAIFSQQDINPGEEITYDYNLDWNGGRRVRCQCGAANCAGYLGAKSALWKATEHPDEASPSHSASSPEAESLPLGEGSPPRVPPPLTQPSPGGVSGFLAGVQATLRFDLTVDGLPETVPGDVAMAENHPQSTRGRGSGRGTQKQPAASKTATKGGNRGAKRSGTALSAWGTKRPRRQRTGEPRTFNPVAEFKHGQVVFESTKGDIRLVGMKSGAVEGRRKSRQGGESVESDIDHGLPVLVGGGEMDHGDRRLRVPRQSEATEAKNPDSQRRTPKRKARSHAVEAPAEEPAAETEEPEEEYDAVWTAFRAGLTGDSEPDTSTPVARRTNSNSGIPHPLDAASRHPLRDDDSEHNEFHQGLGPSTIEDVNQEASNAVYESHFIGDHSQQQIPVSSVDPGLIPGHNDPMVPLSLDSMPGFSQVPYFSAEQQNDFNAMYGQHLLNVEMPALAQEVDHHIPQASYTQEQLLMEWQLALPALAEHGVPEPGVLFFNAPWETLVQHSFQQSILDQQNAAEQQPIIQNPSINQPQFVGEVPLEPLPVECVLLDPNVGPSMMGTSSANPLDAGVIPDLGAQQMPQQDLSFPSLEGGLIDMSQFHGSSNILAPADCFMDLGAATMQPFIDIQREGMHDMMDPAQGQPSLVDDGIQGNGAAHFSQDQQGVDMAQEICAELGGTLADPADMDNICDVLDASVGPQMVPGALRTTASPHLGIQPSIDRILANGGSVGCVNAQVSDVSDVNLVGDASPVVVPDMYRKNPEGNLLSALDELHDGVNDIRDVDMEQRVEGEMEQGRSVRVAIDPVPVMSVEERAKISKMLTEAAAIPYCQKFLQLDARKQKEVEIQKVMENGVVVENVVENRLEVGISTEQAHYNKSWISDNRIDRNSRAKGSMPQSRRPTTNSNHIKNHAGDQVEERNAGNDQSGPHDEDGMVMDRQMSMKNVDCTDCTTGSHIDGKRSRPKQESEVERSRLAVKQPRDMCEVHTGKVREGNTTRQADENDGFSQEASAEHWAQPLFPPTKMMGNTTRQTDENDGFSQEASAEHWARPLFPPTKMMVLRSPHLSFEDYEAVRDVLLETMCTVVNAEEHPLVESDVVLSSPSEDDYIMGKHPADGSQLEKGDSRVCQDCNIQGSGESMEKSEYATARCLKSPQAEPQSEVNMEVLFDNVRDGRSQIDEGEFLFEEPAPTQSNSRLKDPVVQASGESVADVHSPRSTQEFICLFAKGECLANHLEERNVDSDHLEERNVDSEVNTLENLSSLKEDQEIIFGRPGANSGPTRIELAEGGCQSPKNWPSSLSKKQGEKRTENTFQLETPPLPRLKSSRPDNSTEKEAIQRIPCLVDLSNPWWETSHLCRQHRREREIEDSSPPESHCIRKSSRWRWKRSNGDKMSSLYDRYRPQSGGHSPPRRRSYRSFNQERRKLPNQGGPWHREWSCGLDPACMIDTRGDDIDVDQKWSWMSERAPQPRENKFPHVSREENHKLHRNIEFQQEIAGDVDGETNWCTWKGWEVLGEENDCHMNVGGWISTEGSRCGPDNASGINGEYSQTDVPGCVNIMERKDHVERSSMVPYSALQQSTGSSLFPVTYRCEHGHLDNDDSLIDLLVEKKLPEVISPKRDLQRTGSKLDACKYEGGNGRPLSLDEKYGPGSLMRARAVLGFVRELAQEEMSAKGQLTPFDC